MQNGLSRPLGAQISYFLKERGVRVIFGIPGVHNQELYRGVEESGLTHVLARHEQGAAFMADGYARATGGFGVCYLITGPGFLNALTPLGQAYSDGVSVLALASCLDETEAHKGQLHQMKDQEGAGRAVCDWSATARNAQAAYDLLDRALMEFDIGDPRPKAVHVPIKVLEAAASSPGPAPAATPACRPAEAIIETARARLEIARKPLIIFGGGAKKLADRVAGAGLVGPLLDKTGAASLCTYAGRGIVAPDAPLHFGPALARPSCAGLLAEADLVLALGTPLAEVDHWRAHPGHRPGTLIHVDINIEALTQFGAGALCIQADAYSFVEDLLAGWKGSAGSREWSVIQVSRARAHWRAELEGEYPDIFPVMEALRAQMPDQAMIFSDMTQFAYAAKECWDMARPGHWHHPSGFGTLGYSLPAAIGGAVARRGLPTCCIIGDYGLQYTLPELGTAVELGLPLPIVLWDNEKLGAIESSMIAAQIAPNSVIQRNPDFMALARAYGANAVQPSKLDDLGPALNAAFEADRPTLIRLTPRLCH